MRGREGPARIRRARGAATAIGALVTTVAPRGDERQVPAAGFTLAGPPFSPSPSSFPRSHLAGSPPPHTSLSLQLSSFVGARKPLLLAQAPIR
ncbi:hypothetical protein GUJ93_ZPchr0010g10795 [Zizania palustris]|uniref:Uncharacterized protein n=1 Tax=Zizania palustris TaxID=103762 RepID=A0A8J5WC63_ZIZPA|nr:hypothetical protein GUJ93_ZPchr0010g10795 [Zizania palustris]